MRMLTQAEQDAMETRAGSVGKAVKLVSEPMMRKSIKPTRKAKNPKQIVISTSRKKVHYQKIQVESGVEEIVLRIVIGSDPVMHVKMLTGKNGVSEEP